MGFVHCQQARTHAPHERAERRLQSLGRGIDQFEFATQDRGHAPAALVGLQAGIDKGRAQAKLGQGVDLVFHQGNERRDDQGGAAQKPRRNLEGDRLTRARGHDAHAVAAGENGADDRLLARPERRIAENLLQHLARSRKVGAGVLVLEAARDAAQGFHVAAGKQVRSRPPASAQSIEIGLAGRARPLAALHA